MNKAAALAIAAGLAVVGASAWASMAPGEGAQPLEPDPLPPDDAFNPWAPANLGVTNTMDPDRNTAAFLLAIRRFESNQSADAYRMLYGGQLWQGELADHPAALGWKGVKLPDAMCRAAGRSTGCVSTAAGAYQFIRPTWASLKGRLGLADFSPASQDAAAVELIREKGALHLVRSGRFDAAVALLREVWASMPGNSAKQAQHALEAWRTAYTAAGGALA